jgi:hypothetical protein
MNRTLTAAVLVAGLALAGCDSFDPLDKFQDWDIMGAGKKPLQGERHAVFPEGVPGVPQGVPPDLVKGYVAPAEPAPAPVVEEKKAKPRPKVAARPKPKAHPKAVQQPQQAAPTQANAPPASAWPTPPQQQNNTASWPAPPQQQQQNAAWPAPQQQIPGSQPTWPTTAPAPATR